MIRGSSGLRPRFGQGQGQRQATTDEGPSSSSLAVEVGDFAGRAVLPGPSHFLCSSVAEVWVSVCVAKPVAVFL